jgi:NodT family efflux transporter outer membrane factor (OMF) lipoprotein
MLLFYNTIINDLYCFSQLGEKQYSFKAFVVFIAVLFSFILTACTAVGPDYSSPDSSLIPDTWQTEIEHGLPDSPIDNGMLSNWWTQFNDPLLSHFIDLAVTNNKDLHQARARIREARARRGITDSQRYPLLDALGAATISNAGDTGDKSYNDNYSIGIDAGWEIDIFGGLQRSVEAADADMESSQEDLRDVLVSLSAEVALNYIELRTLQARLAITEESLDLQQQSYDLAAYKVQSGLENQIALQQAIYTLESSRAELPDIRSSLNEAKNSLAILTGNIPGTFHELLKSSSAIPSALPSIAIGIPAEMVRRRPDIRKAERNYAAQTARIGVATADLYPKFTLSGSIGIESLDLVDVLAVDNNIWSIGPRVTWNIFDAGSIRRNIEVQSAIQEQYLLAYEQVLLSALEEVGNGLAGYAEEQIRNKTLHVAVDAATQAQSLANSQYQAGLIDFLTLLDTQRSSLSFKNSLLESDGRNTENIVRLYKALGGGWDNTYDNGQDKKNE